MLNELDEFFVTAAFLKVVFRLGWFNAGYEIFRDAPRRSSGQVEFALKLLF